MKKCRRVSSSRLHYGQGKTVQDFIQNRFGTLNWNRFCRYLKVGPLKVLGEEGTLDTGSNL